MSKKPKLIQKAQSLSAPFLSALFIGLQNGKFHRLTAPMDHAMRTVALQYLKA